MIKKPFHYGGTVDNVHFCNRVNETKELITDIDTGLNVFFMRLGDLARRL